MEDSVTDIAEAFHSLLKSGEPEFLEIDHDDDDNDNGVFHSIEDQQGELCHNLSRLLDKVLVNRENNKNSCNDDEMSCSSVTNNKNNNDSKGTNDGDSDGSDDDDDDNNSDCDNNDNDLLTIRNIFGNASSSTLNKMAPLICSLVQHRVGIEALLPGTQDEDANESAISGNMAQTLTRPAMLAGELLAKLLAIPGAWACGVVDLESIMALNALIKRWAIECCGREEVIRTCNNNNRKESLSRPPLQSPPKKKTRRRGTFRQSFQTPDKENYGSQQSMPKSILSMGFDVSAAMALVPRQKEFGSWSPEAREAIVEATITVITTCSALNAAECTVNEAIESLVLGTHAARLQLKHELSVVLMRGLYGFVSYVEVIPNGERGKQAAHKAAILTAQKVLQGIVQNVASNNKNINNTSNYNTPKRNRKKSQTCQTPLTTPKTSTKSARKRRVSFGTSSHKTPLTSPVLKKKLGTPRQHATPGGTAGTSLDPVMSVYVGWIQKLVTSTPGLERVQVRTAVVAALHPLLQDLPHVEVCHILKFLISLSRSKVSVHRLVACEWFGMVLTQDWLWNQFNTEFATSPKRIRELNFEGRVNNDDDDDNESLDMPESLPTALYQALQGRIMDKTAAVRARAITALASVTSQDSAIHIPIDDALLSLLRVRSIKDDTATVRKVAIHTWVQLLMRNPSWTTESDIATLSDLTTDASVWTRKAAAEGLTTMLVLQSIDDDKKVECLEDAWATSVLPMVLDDETGCVSKAVSLVTQVIITPIVEQQQDCIAMAWRILAHVGAANGKGTSKGEVKALQEALIHAARDDKALIYNQLLKRIAKTAYDTMPSDGNAETSEHNMNDLEMSRVGVWCLFEALISRGSKELSSMIKLLRKSSEGIEFIVNAWERVLPLATTRLRRGTLRSCFVVMSRLAIGLDPSSSKTCAMKLLQALKSCNTVSPDVTSVAVAALSSVTIASYSDVKDIPSAVEQIQDKCRNWIHDLFDKCQEEIETFVKIVSSHHVESGGSISATQQESLIRALFMVGEVAMVGFRPDENDSISGRGNSKTKIEKIEDALAEMNEKPSAHLVELVQTLLPTRLPGVGSIETPESIRAHAFTVLGKLCLRDESLAKRSLTLLARELHPDYNATKKDNISTTPLAVQSNALLVLGDLCVRYTNMADRYLPVMASCLQAGTTDPDKNVLRTYNPRSAIVRKHAILLLSSLLLQDYIKWRGLLFHRFLVACADEDESVSYLAETVLAGPLLLRYPKLIVTHFVESLFVLNQCCAHSMYIAAASTGDGGSGIAVGFDGISVHYGAAGEAKRRIMYQWMIDHLSDEEKIASTARLAKEVLGGALSQESSDLSLVCLHGGDVSKLSSRQLSAWNVLSDTFWILTNPKMLKLGKKADESTGSTGTGSSSEPMLPEDETKARRVYVAKGRLLSNISRKHLMEIILPILCQLKAKLESSCSPLLKDIGLYMLKIFQNYKDEVKECLASDPVLLQEMEYDARKQQEHEQNNGEQPPETNSTSRGGKEQ